MDCSALGAAGYVRAGCIGWGVEARPLSGGFAWVSTEEILHRVASIRAFALADLGAALAPNTLLVLVCIIAHADRLGVCPLSVGQIARCCNLSVVTTKRHIKILRERGCIAHWSEDGVNLRLRQYFLR